MSVKDCIIPHNKECKFSNDIWETLKALYETKNTNRLLYLKSKILFIRLEENE